MYAYDILIRIRTRILGILKMFDLFGRLVTELQLLDYTNANICVIECHFWGNGVAAMTNDFTIKVAEVIRRQHMSIAYIIR